ncbi:receiver/sensor box HTH-10 family transcription regulator [Natrialba magadii ATCC 43099]|uniref:PAS/PAC sensor protein n=1 Tax=Natrialba magadii (strain ATCC 43099 / DSM 3394 / CCM 3739 / CIP 104546 / IAM 13178 / JCM 8861 / NBRC 102185 / NCIMB 2190 / MS3) TaxID=547559 RepID=D3SQV8_NATMM|nr:GAF domain-containing protein [Natrialba magadii]ADD04596.1 receiver/sensor box HTH-10 family transcription regulator [Natrialba magadii ATCC 43099]ELY25252.1 PAS/PAC sensor protein [Natrialba magadii ATCC 43099]
MDTARTVDAPPPQLLVVGATLADEFASLSAENGGRLAGADIESVPSSSAALEWLDQQPNADRVDCVVTAADLPDGSGLALLEAIRGRSTGAGEGVGRGDSISSRRDATSGDHSEIPIVLSPAAGDGSDALARAAAAAGSTEYVPRVGETRAGEDTETDSAPAVDTSSVQNDPLLAAVERVLSRVERRDRHREQARQFEAIFDDPSAYAWVLDSDGIVRRANEGALADLDATPSDVRGRELWSLASWGRFDTCRDTIEQAVETAASGRVVRREITRERPNNEVERTGGDDEATGNDRQTLDLTVRPVTDGDRVTTILVRATDVTERAALESDLRESEELHRVTLNHMTDTVLITNDEGEFTYVCPNVHFIFSYTDEEIHEMGSIDELLGADLFDRAELAEDGVLTDIECTATDKAGREHTLLVNVREVSIQDGTHLYSCRDITTRKRREEALTALHRTARELLYAETDREIAAITVDDATDVLDLEASAIYLFDTDENVLRPAARSESMAALHGPLSAQQVGQGIVGDVFVDGESRLLADVHDSPLLAEPTTEIRSAAFVPLGDHGVFVAGSPEVGVFDEVSGEVTDLLATTAEAALDRVERERTLRERDRELKRQNRQLTSLNQINEIIREIDQELVQAETRDEIEHGVCDRLTATDRFSFAWIGTDDPSGERLESRTHGGTDRGRDYLDSVSLSLPEQPAESAASVQPAESAEPADAAQPADGATGDESTATTETATATAPSVHGREPAVRTAVTREGTVVANVVDDLREQPWRSEALAREYQSVISVPLSYDEFSYGVLTVYADRPDAFDEVTRAVLTELGETIASAIAAVDRKRALLSNANTRLEFDVADENFVFTRLATRVDCTISFDGGVRQHEDGATVFASVEGAPAADVAAAATELVAVTDAQVVSDHRRGGYGSVNANASATVSADANSNSNPNPDANSNSNSNPNPDANSNSNSNPNPVSNSNTSTDLSESDRANADETDSNANGERGGTIRLELARPFPALTLADHGAILRSVRATPESTRVVVDVPADVETGSGAAGGVGTGASTDIVTTAFSDIELRSKRRVDRTTPRDIRAELLERLTDRQLEVVQHAYYSGYFESPRERSGEEISSTLSISPAAFYRHHRTVQRKLFTVLFDDLGISTHT